MGKLGNAALEVAVGQHRGDLKIGGEGVKGILSVAFIEEFNVVSGSEHIEDLKHRSRGIRSWSHRRTLSRSFSTRFCSGVTCVRFTWRGRFRRRGRGN